MIEISIITIVKELKEMFPDYIVMIKVGKFYKVYGKDSNIMSYIFEYKINEESKIDTCGNIF